MADNKAKSTKPVNKTPPKSPSDPAKDRAAKRLSYDSNSSHEGAMAGEISALEEAFRKFAIHGDTRATGKEMHGKNWSKLCKDCHVIDGKNVTVTDVDIVFSKIKGKSSRTITFEQFKEALQELSKKRFKDKSDEEAVQEIYKLIEGKAPIISGVTKAISSPTVSRLTDTSKFTGSHKERFDPSGKGKGKAGREDLVDASGYVSGYKHAGTYDHKVQGSKGKSSRTITFEQFKEALQELSKKRFKDKSDEEAVQEIYKLIEGKAPIISGVTKAISSPTVSRLTDTSKFTGSHKERFDPSGKGKGKAGREDLVDASGYVSGYKHAGTYDHKVQGSK